MRLIDADALHLVCSHYNAEAQRIIGEINKAPIIDAVPIDWIDSWCVLTDNEDGVIDVMVADWRRKNE